MKKLSLKEEQEEDLEERKERKEGEEEEDLQSHYISWKRVIDILINRCYLI